MDWPTIIVASILAVIFFAIVITGIRNKMKGKHSCSCGGSCGGCAMNCSCHKTEEDHSA